MEWLTELAQMRETPFWAALALGLLTAVSPCPLATNLTATAFIAKQFTDRRKVLLSGVLYTLGRATSYTAIGVAIFAGASKFHLAKFIQGNGEKWLAPLLIVVGLVLLNVIPLRLPGNTSLSDSLAERFRKWGLLGAFVLGMLFALAFCPYSGVLYFGMLLPMTVASADGLYLPVIFALGTGLPVLVFAYLLAYSMDRLGKAFKAIQRVEKGMRVLAGLAFVATGLYYGWVFLAG